MLRGALCGHADSVWGLVYSSAHQRLLSCSADGTVRLWDANTSSPALAVFNEDQSKGKRQRLRFCPSYLTANECVLAFARAGGALLSGPGLQ